MHIPVLNKEVLEYLAPKPNENFIDGTIGQGGHALLLLERIAPGGRVLGIDLDAGQIKNVTVATAKYKNRVVLAHGSYADVSEIAERENFRPVNGILLDLGYSSWQMEDSGKGFSFQRNELLDMRYDSENTLTAEKIVNEYPQDNLENILRIYGEEKFAKQIAKEIIRHRNKERVQSTFQLKEIIERTVPRKFHHGKIHCATKTFQALRIAVNEELSSLARALPEALKILAPRGRLAVISFHSLEDRIVKNFFKEKEKENLVRILTKKPVMAQEREVSKNPRARSAKLRAIIKI